MRKHTRTLYTLSLGMVVAAGMSAHGQAYSSAVQALNPVAYWPLQETVAPPTYFAPNSGTLGAASYGQYCTWWQTGAGATTNYYFTNSIVHAAGAVGDA